ncbi:MAG: efflux RND transporter periplasmic adaptor subunit [Planctomycetota bacterium]|nr:efflux RND transporter periplasmic adaptor subunit [Planctomycetota bacterium]
MNALPDLRTLRRDAEARPPGEALPLPKPRWKSRVLLPAGLLGAFAVLLALAAKDAWWPALPVKIVPVVAKSVLEGESGGGEIFQAPGWVEADPYITAVSALADGVVKDVLVLEGETVQPGQVVVRLVDDDAKLALADAEALLGQREADVLAAQAVLLAAERDWAHPIERTRALAVSEAGLKKMQAELVRMRADACVETARLQELEEQLRREEKVGRDAIPEFSVVQTGLRVATQRAVLKSAEARVPELEAQVRQMQAELDAARENLALRIPEARALEEAKAAVARARAARAEASARLEAARLRLARMEVRSPAGGIVMRRLAQPGAKLMLGMDDMHSAHALHLYDPRKLQVRVDVPLAQAAQVGVGQACEIVVEVLPERRFKGAVSRIVHEADIQKNTLQVKVAIQDPVETLKPEMLARVKFVAAAAPASGGPPSGPRLFAPEALLRAGASGGRETWIVDRARGTAVRREVTLGAARQDGWVEVRSGLQAGDVLIADAPASLRDGQRVRIAGEADTVPEAPDAAPAESNTPGKGENHGAH